MKRFLRSDLPRASLLGVAAASRRTQSTTADRSAPENNGTSSIDPSKSDNAAAGGKLHATKEEAVAAAREALVQELISRDKELFELKRLHELSMLRVEQNQRRILKDQEDRAMYYEQNVNVHTFDTVSVNEYTKRSSVFNLQAIAAIRNLKTGMIVWGTFLVWSFLYYRYMVNTDFEYVEAPVKSLAQKFSSYRNTESPY